MNSCFPAIGPKDVGNSACRYMQQDRCSVTCRLTPLLLRVGCAPSLMTAVAKIRRRVCDSIRQSRIGMTSTCATLRYASVSTSYDPMSVCLSLCYK